MQCDVTYRDIRARRRKRIPRAGSVGPRAIPMGGAGERRVMRLGLCGDKSRVGWRTARHRGRDPATVRLGDVMRACQWVGGVGTSATAEDVVEGAGVGVDGDGEVAAVGEVVSVLAVPVREGGWGELGRSRTGDGGGRDPEMRGKGRCGSPSRRRVCLSASTLGRGQYEGETERVDGAEVA